MSEADIERRLRTVEDRLALIELEAAYARHFDARDGDAWAALFTTGGVYRSRDAVPGGRGNFVEGRAALAAFCSGAAWDGIHLLHLPQLTIAGDRAEGRVHLEFIGLFHGSGAPGVRMTGYYDVDYERVDGRWLIRERVTTTFTQTSTSTPGYPVERGIARR